MTVSANSPVMLEAVPDDDPGHEQDKQAQHSDYQHRGLSGNDQGYDEAFYSADSDYEKYCKHGSIYREHKSIKW